MTNREIGNALAELGVHRAMEPTAGGGGHWEFAIAGTPAFVQTQSNVNRMRIAAIVGNPKKRSNARLTEFMEANYRSALDVRYALADGQLAVAFLHPLSSLTKEQFLDGVRQVSLAVRTAGAENASSPITYGLAAFSRPSEQFQDPEVESGQPTPPDRYKAPWLVKDVLLPILIAVIAAIAGAYATAIFGVL